MESQVPESGQPREVVILGSTGSIGTQALDIVRRNPGRFRVVALAAGGGQPDVLASQAAEFGVAAVAVANPAAAAEVQDALRSYFVPNGPRHQPREPVCARLSRRFTRNQPREPVRARLSRRFTGHQPREPSSTFRA